MKSTILEKVIVGVGLGVVILVIAAIISLIAAVPTYFLWNWLMPDLFGIKAVTFFQAWGINFLAAILFKNGSSSSSSEND